MAFNKITRFSVEFRALGQTYNVEVHKEYSRTPFAGAEWRRFITENGINAGVYLFFSMGDPGPRISVVHFDEGVEEYSGDEEGGDDNHPVKSTIFSRRCNLSNTEEENLIDNFPPANSFIGLPFVTRLTKTNIKLHNMVCFQVIICFSFSMVFVLSFCSI